MQVGQSYAYSHLHAGHGFMNTHPTELLPAYVLGALGEREFRAVEAHIQVCSTCRAEVEEFRTSVGLAASAVLPAPRDRVKHYLMARIHTSKHHGVTSHHPAIPPLARVRWSSVFAGAALAMALLFGGMMVDARQQLHAVQDDLTQLRSTMAQDEATMTAFLSDPTTIGQPMNGQGTVAAKMYMQIGRNRTVLLISGLSPPASGRTYQFWLADQTRQVAAGTFAVDSRGIAHVMFDAPAPVNTYAEAMVTVEPTGGSTLPTGEIVLAVKLEG